MCLNRNYDLLCCLETQRLHGSFLHGSRLGWLLHSLSINFLNIGLDNQYHHCLAVSTTAHNRGRSSVLFMSKIIANHFSSPPVSGFLGYRNDSISRFFSLRIVCHWFHLIKPSIPSSFCSFLLACLKRRLQWPQASDFLSPAIRCHFYHFSPYIMWKYSLWWNKTCPVTKQQ